RIAADIEVGLAIPDADYQAGLRHLAVLRHAFWARLGPDDLVLIPAAPDVAPEAGTTGDPAFVIPTTVLGGPVATLRAGLCPDTGMPIGALLFGAPGRDALLAGMLLSQRAAPLDL
ncbi:MAG: hypothetical protein K2X74_07770, partial [Acetobacteraceae bacterium]|nr:hypothetical protein [Acetobacteraceae bacterium]